jgi:tRNA A37 threonylcarbamoyladenosine modification protein TsaB
VRLFVQTSSGRYQIALTVGTEVIFNSADLTELEGTRDLQRMLMIGLQTIDEEIEALSEVVVDAGPGGLAATRAGAAFSNAIAYSLNLSLKQVGAFDLLRAEASFQGYDSLCVVRRGPPGMMHWGIFEKGKAGDQSCVPLSAAVAALDRQDIPKIVAGDIRPLKNEFDARNEVSGQHRAVRWLNLNHAGMESFFHAHWYDAPTSNGISTVTPSNG